MKVLVTGGAGFIGSHVLEALLAKGHEPVVLDNLSHGKREHVPEGVPLIVADLNDPGACEIALKAHQCEAIIHLAAQKSVTASVNDPIQDAQDNIIGSLQLLEAARSSGVSKVVFASTGGALYGETDQLPTPESHSTYPEAPYGIAKLSVEHYLRFYSQIHGFQTSVLRLANVYGPRQDPLGEAGVVAIFCGRILAGKRSLVFGDGLQTRDYVYVKDVADAMLMALESDRSHLLNIGTAVESTVIDLLTGLQASTSLPVSWDHEAPRAGELRASCLDCAKAERELGWKSQWRLADGLAATFRAFHEAQ